MKTINRTRIIFALYDLVLVVLCTMATAYLHNGLEVDKHSGSFLFAAITFPLLWLFLSLVTRKFRIGERSNQREVFSSIIFSNFVILSVITILLFFFRVHYFSRFIIFGTLAAITFFEILTGFIYVAIQKSVFLKDWIGLDITEEQRRCISQPPHPEILSAPKEFDIMSESITEEAGEDAFSWIHSKIDITDPRNLILSTNTRFNIINHPNGFYNGLVNLQRINNLRRINKFFETVNSKLPYQGVFIGCVETYWLRKQRILTKFPPILNHVVYAIDFLLNRVFPKIVITRKLYFLITRGKKRVISRTETLGRLYSCGFEILEEKSIGDLLYWKAQKVKLPLKESSSSYGIFIRLPRIGKNGELFKVYKLRTMHAYAEYLQEYVYKTNKLDEGGKFKDDFRVTTIGKILRNLWIDELPMLVNVVKGNMKFVGVRPLTEQYFSLYAEEVRNKRIKGKPGLIPPYYAQYPSPVSIEDIQANEMKYLLEYEQHPTKTDFKYFFMAMYYIFIRRARSK